MATSSPAANWTSAGQSSTQDIRSQQGLTGAKLSDAVKQQSTDMLRDEIDSLLLVQKAKDLNIDIDADLNRQLAQMQVESKITDTDKFHDWIRMQTGMPFEEYRDALRKELLTQRVISEEIGSRITIPEADLRKYYDAHKDRVHAQGAGLSQPDRDLHRRQDARADGRGREESQGPGGAGPQGRKIQRPGAANSDDPETARNGGQLPALSSAACCRSRSRTWSSLRRKAM